MFSSNGKISSRQLKRLLVLDFFGKSAVLLPNFARDMGSREFIFCLLLILLFMLFYASLVRKLSMKVRESFFGYLKERLGRGTALALVMLFFLYALFNLVYLLDAFGSLGSTFILTEERPETVMILALLAGLSVALKGGEVRGRVAECLYPVLFYPMVFLLIFSAFHVRPDYVAGGSLRMETVNPKHLVEMFSVFGGMGFYLFLAPGVGNGESTGKKDKKQRDKGDHRALVEGMGQVAAALLGLFVILAGAFGDRGISGLTWPVVTLMSSAKLPGVFLERWDVIFTGLLLTMLFVSVGSSIYYLLILGSILFPGCSKKALGWSVCGAAFLLAIWCGSSERAAELYVFINSYVVVPLWVALVLLLLCLEKIKGRKNVCG